MALYLWIGVGSALGGMTRYGLGSMIARRFGEEFPWATLTINIAGSFLIGLFAALAFSEGSTIGGATARHFVMTGILGGFTTYSAFSLQTLVLLRNGEWGRAGAYALGTFVLCFVAVALGHLSALGLNAMRH